MAKRFRKLKNKLMILRRVKSTAYIIISQALLIALAISWAIHMVIIAANGSVHFVENNPYILWAEIIGLVLITVFAVFMISSHIQKLGGRH